MEAVTMNENQFNINFEMSRITILIDELKDHESYLFNLRNHSPFTFRKSDSCECLMDYSAHDYSELNIFELINPLGGQP